MIEISSHSGIYTLKSRQVLPLSKKEAWEFLSNPGNLKDITPHHMGFQITSIDEKQKMYPGQIITYKVSPFKGVRMNWVTEITHVEEESYFVDEQRFGPYRFWHHKHFLNEVNGGTEMIDQISYKIPYGVLGRFLHFMFIRKQLLKIFSYRQDIMGEMFDEALKNEKLQ